MQNQPDPAYPTDVSSAKDVKIATLPFFADPTIKLAPNKNIAMITSPYSNNQCFKTE